MARPHSSGRWLLLAALGLAGPARAQDDPPDYLKPPKTIIEVVPAQSQVVTRPNVLNRPLEPATPPPLEREFVVPRVGDEPPLGFTGPSGVAPAVRERTTSTRPSRTAGGSASPSGTATARATRACSTTRTELGRSCDPYNQNVLKGDYPIIGQHTFLNITGDDARRSFEGRDDPDGDDAVREHRPRRSRRVLRPARTSSCSRQPVTLSFDLFHGDAAFKPVDWRVKLTPAFNVNTSSVQELAVVSPDVRKGTIRNRTWTTLQEWFVEVQAGRPEPGVRLRVGPGRVAAVHQRLPRLHLQRHQPRRPRSSATLDGNRDQFNLAYFRQLEKDTNSGLNTFDDRNQNIVIANYYRQDFIFPGYTAQASVHYNNDGPDFLFDQQPLPGPPDPAGVFQPHRVEACYLGLAGDGHIDRYNISHAFYWALGRDSRNPIAGRPQTISGQMAALELSYDRDWARFRRQRLLRQSGDGNVEQRPGDRLRRASSTTRTSPAASSASGSGKRIPLFGVEPGATATA